VLGISVVELFDLDGAAIKLSKPIEKIDLKLMDKLRALDPRMKRNALALLRRMNKHASRIAKGRER
jgi:hypothetical protein